MKRTSLAGAAAFLFAAAAAAAPAPDTLARIVAVQPPAWLLHQGTRGAALPGAVLVAGDMLETGADGRVHFEAAEGSTVKLGEQAQMQLPILRYAPAAPQQAHGAYTATLHVLKGAFRFTTGLVDKLRPRDISLQVGQAITAGIRGTDIWSKADEAQDLLCLIDGRVEIGGDAPLLMDQPRTFYVVLKGQPPKKVVPVPDGKFDTWFPQTDLKPGEPALYADGRWAVVLITYAGREQARTQAGELSERGFPAQVRPASIHGKPRYRVAIPGLRSRADAMAFARLLKSRYSYSGWVLPPGQDRE
jgi:hypothetical protein